MGVALIAFQLTYSAPAFAQAKSKPIEGPQLDGPITPNTGSEIEANLDKSGPDAAFGAFQRGYYLTALELALPPRKVHSPG